MKNMALLAMAYFVWVDSGFGMVLVTVTVICVNSVLHYQPD